MKKTILLCMSLFSFAQANTGVGHGGGGEWNIIKCNAFVANQQELSLTVCLTGDTNDQGLYEIIPCGNDSSPYVTIQRSIKVSAVSQMIDTSRIPGLLFSVNWSEKGFFLSMKDPIAGELRLARLGTPEQDQGTTLHINIPSMKYKLKSVSCHFGSN